EYRSLGKRIVMSEGAHVIRAPNHTLKEQQVACGVTLDQIECKQRMAQVIKDTHEHHEIEPLTEKADLVDTHPTQFDFDTADLGGKSCLGQIGLVGVDTQHPLGAAPLHLDGVEPCIATHVEHRFSREVLWDRLSEVTPLVAG